ncbi:heavy metal translocating P-type ATPase [Candidatus Magnetaquiglobus chichijimensis]|uniref:heavy metal translocating P-type ATPase n=1 Tax=Candidatus Magnetaquiglobus chichijimensis TaxID=3141448 RepID=UPI003B9747A3
MSSGLPFPDVLDGDRMVLRVSRLCCPTEADLIRKALMDMKEILHLDFDFIRRELMVIHRGANRSMICAALRTVNMEPDPDPTVADTLPGRSLPPRTGVSRREWTITTVAGLAALVAEGLVWGGLDEQSPWIVALALASLSVGGVGTLKRGWIAMRHVSLNIHFLMSLAVLGAMALGQWPEAAMVVFLFGLAERIEALSMDRARHAIRGLMALAPETATLRNATGEWESVAASSVSVGSVLRVKPGERIALDGVVTDGRSDVNQAPITGESVPVMKETGQPLFAGSINGSGVLEFRVTADFRHSTLARIIDTVQEAQAKRAPMQRFVDRFARYYTPAVVGIAMGIALLPPLLFGAPFSVWVYNALVMLVVACPCALVISTPVTVVSGLAAGARRGILIKGGLYLEQAHALRAVALDKTGTLTHGQLEMTDCVVLNDHDKEKVLRLAASLASHSEHPVSAAILASWGKERPLLQVRHFEALAGRGVRGTIAGEVHHLGNHRLLEELGLCRPEVEKILLPLEQDEKTVVVLSSFCEPLAIIAVADRMRAGAPQAVERLRKLGITVTMLTGDNTATATAIARHAGIDDVRAERLPEEKLRAIEGLMGRFGVVAMVGDGINDAPALARASIGIAMGATGTDTALETADVAIMNDDLGKVAEFVRLGRATRRILWENIALALGIKSFFLILAGLGVATLWMAVLADMGTSLLVIFNGRRLLRFFA